jgi:hypothetical protein
MSMPDNGNDISSPTNRIHMYAQSFHFYINMRLLSICFFLLIFFVDDTDLIFTVISIA